MRRSILVVVLLAAAAPAQAQPPASTLTPAEVVLARQAAMGLSGGVLELLQKAAESGAEVRGLGYQAYTLDAWARALPGLFPTGTGPKDPQVRNRARPEIWSDPAGFAAQSQAFAQATGRLRELSKSNDAVGFKAQVREIESRCNACHAAFRAGPA